MMAMRKMERKHYEEVKEIEELFERKLKQEGDGYLKLEQEGLEMKQAYESKIKQIKENNAVAIRKLVDEFKQSLLKVQEEFNLSKT